jgi:hypothetical protein
MYDAFVAADAADSAEEALALMKFYIQHWTTR